MGLARDLGAPSVLIHGGPGVTSALGLLLADLRYDFTATYLGSLDEQDLARLERVSSGARSATRRSSR